MARMPRASADDTVVVTTKDWVANRWYAELRGLPQTKISGKSQAEALGKLILAKPRLFSFAVARDLRGDHHGPPE